MGALVVLVEMRQETLLGKPNIAIGIAARIIQRGEVKKVRHGEDSGFEEEVIAPAGIRRHEQHPKGGLFGVLNGQPKATRQRRGDVVAKAALLVIGDIGQKFVRELFRCFRGHIHFQKKETVPRARFVDDMKAVGIEGQFSLGFPAGFLVSLGKGDGPRNVGMARAGAQPQSRAGVAMGKRIQGDIEVGDGEFMPKGIFRERRTVFHTPLVVAQRFIQFGALASL